MPPALADMRGTTGGPAVREVAPVAAGEPPAQTSKRPRAEPEGAVQVDHSELFSEEGRARKMARLRVLVTSFAGKEGVIGLHGGLPPASAFPITEMALTLRDGTRLVIDDPAKVRLELYKAHTSSKRIQLTSAAICLQLFKVSTAVTHSCAALSASQRI